MSAYLNSNNQKPRDTYPCERKQIIYQCASAITLRTHQCTVLEQDAVPCAGFILAGAEKKIQDGQKKNKVGQNLAQRLQKKICPHDSFFQQGAETYYFKFQGGGGILTEGAYAPPVLKQKVHMLRTPLSRRGVNNTCIYAVFSRQLFKTI